MAITIDSVLIPAMLGADGSGSFRVAPDVRLITVADGTARLLDLGGGFYALSETAAAMLLAGLRSGPEVAALDMATRFGLGADNVRADLQALFSDLERAGLLIRSEDESEAGSDAPGWNFRLTLVALRLFTCLPQLPLRLRTWALLTLAWATTRQASWSRAVQAWGATPATGLHGRATRSRVTDRHGSISEEAASIAATVARSVAHHPLPMECKERTLCCWALARAAGLPARVVVGVELFPFTTHCWCESGSRVLSDSQGQRDRFTPVALYE